MKVLLANPRGFCAGVNMAIECLDQMLKLFGPPVYVFHEIVHNRPIVERFKKKGAIFVQTLSEVPQGRRLLYSAHGVSPEIKEEASQRELKTIDATCPLVTKVHLEAIRFANNGYQIFLIGHKGHDEVIGTMGEAPHSIELVETTEDVERLDPKAYSTNVAYLTQTTLSVDDANQIIKALKEKFPQIEGPPREDICYATQNRQEAVKVLAQEAELVLVIGSQNSSNSQRLCEIAKSLGIQAYLVDGVEEIDPVWLKDVNTVLITAGASAPEDLVQQCIGHLSSEYQAEIVPRSLKSESVTFALPRALTDYGAPSQTL